MEKRLRRLWSMAVLSTKYFLFMLTFSLLFLGVPMLLAFGVGVASMFVAVFVLRKPVPEGDAVLVIFSVAFVAISLLFVYLAHQTALAQRLGSWLGLPVVRPARARRAGGRNWSLRELLLRARLKWREPRAVRRVVIAMEQKDTPREAAPAFIGAFMAMLVFVATLNGVLTGEMPLLRLVLISPAVIAFCVFLPYVFIPLLTALVPSVIRISDRLIMRDSGVPAVWRYERIARCDIVKQQFDGFDALVLCISLHDGSQHIVGIADTVCLTDLQRLLSDHGVQVSLDEKTGM